MKIDSRKFNFSFFLSNKVKVNNLEEAAKKNGGATLNFETGELYSNIPGNEFIELKKDRELNTISLFIPDTYNINESAGKEKLKKIVSTVIQKVYKRYESVPTMEKGLGSWYSEELQQVVYDNLIIASVHIEDVSEEDIKFFIKLAGFIKKEMRQEAVSITINEALALI